MKRTAKAEVVPVRQRTQYTCMSTSMMMCLQALGHECDEDEVNKVMGARPMKGASWEQALACAQHYGCRATLTMPSTVSQLKEWTDKGVPVMIAWNPEGRDWSHASVVFDVTEENGEVYVHVADPNIPDPEETVRKVTKGEFYSKWSEKWPNYLVRRPACAIEREITPKGRQVMASNKTARVVVTDRLADVPAIMEEMAGAMLDAYIRTVPLVRRYIKHIAVVGFTKSNYHITVIAPGWSALIDEDRPDYDHDRAMEFRRQSEKGMAVMTAIAKRYDYKPTGRGKWLSDGKHNLMLGLAGGHGRSSSNKTALSPVAKDILDQMGGMRRLMMMIGARDFVYGPKSISFRWPNKQRSKGNMLKVTLRGDDTYKVEFLNVAKYNVKVVKKHEGIHAEDLVELFERQTGWYLRMGSEQRLASLHTARAKKKKKPLSQKDRMKIDKTKPKTRNTLMKDMAEGKLFGGGAAGKHHTRDRDVAKGRSRKPKHKKDWSERAAHYPFNRTTLNEAACRLANAYLGKQENSDD